MSSSSSSLIITLAVLQHKLTLYIYPLWMIFGITGCLCNLIVFSRPQLRTTSCSIYFFAATVDHIMTLIIGIGPVLYSLNNPDPQAQTLLFCKMRGYLFQICLMLSRWFIAFACIDRYALTSDQIHRRNFAKTKIAYRILILMFIIWSIICSHRVIFYEIKGNTCGIVTSMGAALYHSAYVIVGGAILPSAIMIVCACLIRRNLAHKQQRRVQISSVTYRQNSLDQQILNLLSIQVICYLIFIIPQLCNLVFNAISITDPYRSMNHLAVERFVAFFAELMLYLFPVTSFYLYTLTSRTFRNELLKFFRPILICCWTNRITSELDGTTLGARLENMKNMRTITMKQKTNQHNVNNTII